MDGRFEMTQLRWRGSPCGGSGRIGSDAISCDRQWVTLKFFARLFVGEDTHGCPGGAVPRQPPRLASPPSGRCGTRPASLHCPPGESTRWGGPACRGGLRRRHRNRGNNVLLSSLQLGGEVARHLLLASSDLGREFVDLLAHRGEIS